MNVIPDNICMFLNLFLKVCISLVTVGGND